MRAINNTMSEYLLQNLKSSGSKITSTSSREEELETLYNRSGVTIKGIGTARSVIKANIYYSLMEASSKAIQSSAENLLETGETSVFAKAEAAQAAAEAAAESEKTEETEITESTDGASKTEKSNKEDGANPYTEDVADEVLNFVSLYNSMMKSLNRTGDTTEKAYANELSSYAKKYEDALKTAGITIQRDGSLKVNEKTLEKASISELKKVFHGKGSFADLTATASIKIESFGTANVNYLNSSTYSSLLKGFNSKGTSFDTSR